MDFEVIRSGGKEAMRGMGMRVSPIRGQAIGIEARLYLFPLTWRNQLPADLEVTDIHGVTGPVTPSWPVLAGAPRGFLPFGFLAADPVEGADDAEDRAIANASTAALVEDGHLDAAAPLSELVDSVEGDPFDEPMWHGQLVADLTVDELREACRSADLPVSGKKAELAERLTEYVAGLETTE